MELVEHRLTEESAAELHHHVRQCEDCRRVLAELGRAIGEEDLGGEASTMHRVGESPPAPAPLAPGERVGRFQVERLVGEGGMGAVYAARDPQLGRTVALKLLRVRGPAGGDSASPRNRLLREAQAMARLAHPNVVTIFEVGTLDDQVFLAMELVEGSTLTRWLAARARTWDEVLEVFLEAGRGLATAHAAGLVHRDFKPDNVLVGDDGRVRVMDFGLARAITLVPDDWPAGSAPEHLSPDSRLTETGALLGTPAYMSPEQMRGLPVDARADLFSFCGSLYEALYGQRAYEADSLLELRQKIEANEVSTPPPGRKVPSWVRRELLRGLRADPAERHATMDELLAALSRGRERRSTRRVLLAIGVLVAVAAVLLPVGLRLAARPTSTKGSGRMAVAVLLPRNLTARPEKAWLGSALAEMVSTELGAGQQLRVIPGENVAVALNDLRLSGMDTPGQEVLRKLAANLDADLFLSGSFAVLGAADQLRVDLRAQDAHTGEAVARVAEVGEEAKLFELVGRVGARLRRELRVGSPEPDSAVQASFPANPEAAKLFSEGLVQLRGFEPGRARDTLERAVKIAPTNPRILAALSDAYTELGEEERAKDAAQRAFENAEGLPRDERLSIESLYRRATKERGRVVEIGRALVTFFPDDIEHGLRLGYAQVTVGDRAGALSTVGALRKLPPPAGKDPRIDLLEWQAEYTLGDLKAASEAAARAVAAGRAKGARRVVALGRYDENLALYKRNEQAAAAQALSEAQQLFREIGDRGNEARTMTTSASRASDLGLAQAQLEAAIGVFREMGNRTGEMAVLANLGNLQWREHRLAAALQSIDQAIALNRETYNPQSLATSLYIRGLVLKDQGELEAARRSIEASLASFREIHLKDREPALVIVLAELAAIRGELAQAQRLCREVEATQPPGEKVQTSRVRWALARFAFEDGRFKDAEKLADEVKQRWTEMGLAQHLAGVHALRARALLGLGRREEAAGAVAEAKALLSGDAPLDALAVAIADASVVAAGGTTGLDKALGRIKELLEQARARSLIEDQLNLRLTLGELDQGEAARARKQLKDLASESRARGFALIARKAEAALKRRDQRK